MAAIAPRRRVEGLSIKIPMAISATPLAYVQKDSLGGSHGGTMSLKNSGLTKCITPASNTNAPRTTPQP